MDPAPPAAKKSLVRRILGPIILTAGFAALGYMVYEGLFGKTPASELWKGLVPALMFLSVGFAWTKGEVAR